MDVVKVVGVGEEDAEGRDAADGGRWFPGIHPHWIEQLRGGEEAEGGGEEAEGGGEEAEGEVKSPCWSMPLNMPLKMSH